jgi:hypothetical protein
MAKRMLVATIASSPSQVFENLWVEFWCSLGGGVSQGYFFNVTTPLMWVVSFWAIYLPLLYKLQVLYTSYIHYVIRSFGNLAILPNM